MHMSIPNERPTGHWRPTDTLANRVALIRNEMGLTQREMALRTGITFGKIQGIENGRSVHHEVEVLNKIATSLGVDRDWLMHGGGLGGVEPEWGGQPVTRKYQTVSPLRLVTSAA